MPLCATGVDQSSRRTIRQRKDCRSTGPSDLREVRDGIVGVGGMLRDRELREHG